MKFENQTPTPTKLTALKSIVAGWITAIFMLYTVFPSTVYAWATIAVFLLCAFKISSKKSGFVVITALTAVAFFAFGASAEVLAYVLSIIATAVLGGIMLSEKKSCVVFIVFAGIVFTAVALLKTPLEALTSLVGLPMAVSLAVSAKVKASRVASICAASGMFLATLILPVAISFYGRYGAESAEQFKLLLEEFRVAWTDAMVSVSEEMFTNGNENLLEVFNKETVSALVDTTINLLPAILIILSNAVALSAQTLSLYVREFLLEFPQESEKKFMLSKVSAWLYIISFIVMLVVVSDSDTARVITLATQNINVILTPSFLLAGIASLSSAFHMPEGRRRTGYTVMIILAFLYCGTFLIYPIVALGVIRTLKSNKKPQ